LLESPQSVKTLFGVYISNIRNTDYNTLHNACQLTSRRWGKVETWSPCPRASRPAEVFWSAEAMLQHKPLRKPCFRTPYSPTRGGELIIMVSLLGRSTLRWPVLEIASIAALPTTKKHGPTAPVCGEPPAGMPPALERAGLGSQAPAGLRRVSRRLEPAAGAGRGDCFGRLPLRRRDLSQHPPLPDFTLSSIIA